MTMWNVIDGATICGGIAFILSIVGFFVWMIVREDKDRSVVPWGSQRRVERARADAQVAEFRVKHETDEIRYLALQPMRVKVEEAVASGEYVSVAELMAGPASDPEGARLREARFGKG